MKLVVGLGNPGKKYDGTRHNVGFAVIDQLAEHLHVTLNEESKFKSLIGKTIVDGETVFVLKPLTYMNLSGEAVGPFMKYYDISAEDVLVIYDDLDLQPGSLRLRMKGGHGGHNGIKSLISHIGTKEFKRIRIGVGRPEPGTSVVSHVLGRFSPDEKEKVSEVLVKAKDSAVSWFQQPFDEVMNEFNRK